MSSPKYQSLGHLGMSNTALASMLENLESPPITYEASRNNMRNEGKPDILGTPVSQRIRGFPKPVTNTEVSKVTLSILLGEATGFSIDVKTIYSRSGEPRSAHEISKIWAKVHTLRGFGKTRRLRRAKPASKNVRITGPIKLLRQVIEDWNFDERETAILLGFDKPIEARRLLQGIIGISQQRDARDRLRAVLTIAGDLENLFREVSAIRAWLDEPQPMLEDATPRALLTQGSMENVLRVRQYVEYLSGR